MSTRHRSLYTLFLGLLLMQLGSCGGHATAGGASHPTPSAAHAASAQSAPATPPVDLDWDHSAAKVPVTWNDPIWGRPDAPVTIVEFTDYECPFCKRVTKTLDEIRNSYGPNKVRIVTLHNPLPFHKHAYAAAVAATTVFQLAGSYAFYRFTEIAFENQDNLSDDNYVSWAVACGIDAQAFRQALASERARRKVDADMALAKQLGASGTPGFRINGVTVTGAQPFERFAQVIDEQVAEAKKLVHAGTQPKNVYVTLANRNADVRPPEVKSSELPSPEEDTKVYRMPVMADDPVLGSPNARVTVVEFSDFQCPFCKRAEATLKQIREHYGNDVRIVWKDLPLPFHPQALPAAILARLVYAQKGNREFWALHDELFEAQPDIGNEKLEALARKHGVSWAKVQAERSGGNLKERIEATSETAEAFNVRGTPNFFINGIVLTGAQPYEKFQARIDSELEKAKALEATGVKPAKLYEELTKIGQGPPDPERKSAPLPNAGRPSRGAANAIVVIQEWADFQCPFCGRVEPTLESLLKEFPTQARLVWRHLPLPFHNFAPLAAEAAEEAFAQGGNATFWKYHDRLFEAQSEPDGLSEANLVKIARELGLDGTRFQTSLANHVHRKLIDADSNLAESIAIAGAPAFVINGYFVSDAQPIGAFRRIVKRALSDARNKPNKIAAAIGGTAPTPDDIQTPPTGATRTASGLHYVVLRKGTGKQHPSATSRVKVHYSGRTTDGNLFDSSIERGQPSTFGLNQVIRGWTEGVQRMVVGEKSRFWIPPELAYGINPHAGVPGGTLVFDIELLGIE